MTLHDDVSDLLARLRPAEAVLGLGGLSVSRGRVAGTAAVPARAGEEPQRRAAIVSDGRLAMTQDEQESYGPQWSADSERLAWIVARSNGSAVVVATSFEVDRRERAVPDVVEGLAWSPDGRRLLLVVAEAGAQLSDVVGSGTLPKAASDTPSWQPTVDTGVVDVGWRRAWTWDLTTDDLRRVSPDELNVWQATWRGDDRIVLIASDGPTESDWYGASLVEVDVASGDRTVLTVPDGQLARAAVDPTGGHVSVIVGPMSDRGSDAGRLVVDGVPVELDVDVTDQVWTGPDDVVFAGLRGLRTVIGRHRPSTGETSVVWESDATCGEHGPEVGADADSVVAWVHGYERPAALVGLDDGAERMLWQPSGTAPTPGRLERRQWTSTDGTAIDGLLVLPEGSGPFPLVVHLHGGPVWAWRDEWSMHYPFTPVFVSRGYAVLHPNPRGSSGRGAGFVHDGLRDLGGRDADDILTGVDALIAEGTVDPRRVVVTGNSYGGFMAAWLATSDRFAAAAARSPVTEWVSQHLTSNLPAFDELCFDGPVLDPGGHHRARSPLFRADSITAPMLLVAGARDLATPADQAVMLHRALIERGHPSTLIVYPEEGHGVRHHDALVDLCVRLVEFFGAHTA